MVVENEMRKIAVVFPGVGYTKDRPLLYYAGKNIGAVVATAYARKKSLRVKQKCFSPLELINGFIMQERIMGWRLMRDVFERSRGGE